VEGNFECGLDKLDHRKVDRLDHRKVDKLDHRVGSTLRRSSGQPGSTTGKTAQNQ
jgi:hypothetical protein